MQWVYLIIALIVGFGIGHYVGWMGQQDTPADAALTDKIPNGSDPGEYVRVRKQLHDGLLKLWHALQPDNYYGPEETLIATRARLLDAEQDTLRLLRLHTYHSGARPIWLDTRSERPLQDLRDRIDKWPEGAMSGIKKEHTSLRRALELYVGKSDELGNPFGQLIQRHLFIQEQANQCGYSTILYSLSPSSSIFTPSYVNGFRGYAKQPDSLPAESSTSNECRLRSEHLSGGLSVNVSLGQQRTRCPSCPQTLPTPYKQKCIQCRRASRPIP